MATVEIDSVKIFDTLTPMQQDELLDSLNEKQYSGDEVVIEQVVLGLQVVLVALAQRVDVLAQHILHLREI